MTLLHAVSKVSFRWSRKSRGRHLNFSFFFFFWETKLFIKYSKCNAQTLIAYWLLYSLKSFTLERAVGTSRFSLNGVNATRQGLLFNWLLYSNEVFCAFSLNEETKQLVRLKLYENRECHSTENVYIYIYIYIFIYFSKLLK